MEKAYFKNIRSEIIPLLRNAKQEVVVAMAWFTSKELFQTIIDCLQRNVKVELILLDNASNFMYYAPDFNIFINAGGILRIARVSNGFMHHKFCVIDNSYVITGSYNWTYYAETRNIENIFVSNSSDIIQQYYKEFKSLADRISKVSESPRISWDDIGSYEYINYDELNYEISEIAKSQHLPIKQVVKPSTEVKVVERPLNPISKYSIGIQASLKGNNRSMITIIPKGAKLPYVSIEEEFYNYSDHRNKVICSILYDKGDHKEQITEKAITDITSGRNDLELRIRVQFTLVQSGDLHAEIRCVETGKVISVKASKPDFVDYAE